MYVPITEAVVGDPLWMSGDRSLRAGSRGRPFLLTVHVWDERPNTTETRRHLDKLVHCCAPNLNGDGRTVLSISWPVCYFSGHFWIRV